MKDSSTIATNRRTHIQQTVRQTVLLLLFFVILGIFTVIMFYKTGGLFFDDPKVANLNAQRIIDNN